MSSNLENMFVCIGIAFLIVPAMRSLLNVNESKKSALDRVDKSEIGKFYVRYEDK